MSSSKSTNRDAPVRALVVIPTYNEAENIERLCEALSQVAGVEEVLVVDDASPDGTGDKVAALAGRLPVRLLRRSAKNGRGGAVLDGFEQGLREERFTHFVEMDSDFSHDPAELPLLLEQALRSDVVIGSRYIPHAGVSNWPLRRRIFSFCANWFIRFMLRLPVRDFTNGYRCYSQRAIAALDRSLVQPKGFIALSAILFQLSLKGFSVAEVPTHFVNRVRGVSNLGGGEIWEALRSVIRLRKLGKTLAAAPGAP